MLVESTEYFLIIFLKQNLEVFLFFNISGQLKLFQLNYLCYYIESLKEYNPTVFLSAILIFKKVINKKQIKFAFL